MTQTTYAVIQMIPLQKNILRRHHKLCVGQFTVFVSTHYWLSWLVAKFYSNSCIETRKDELEIVEFGDELAEDFCHIYKVKNSADAFALPKKSQPIKI